MEYASPIWSPYTNSDEKLFESVQTKFLRRLSFVNMTPMRFDDHDYSEIRRTFDICTLESRRNVADLNLLYKILHGQIDSPYLLSNISLHIPQRQSRQQQLFALPFCRTLRAQNSLLGRMHRLGNTITNSIDIFSVPLSTFSKHVSQHFNIQL